MKTPTDTVHIYLIISFIGKRYIARDLMVHVDYMTLPMNSPYIL